MLQVRHGLPAQNAGGHGQSHTFAFLFHQAVIKGF
jgi:hypothetical protein